MATKFNSRKVPHRNPTEMTRVYCPQGSQEYNQMYAAIESCRLKHQMEYRNTLELKLDGMQQAFILDEINKSRPGHLQLSKKQLEAHLAYSGKA